VKLLHKFKPITFFFAGLLLGLGYIGASYMMHLMVLQKAGTRLSEEVEKYQQLTLEYDESQAHIDQLSQWSDEVYSELLTSEQHYKNHLKSFQSLVTDLVHIGKSHNLTFLDYHSEPSVALDAIEEARLFTSQLSLGGSFKDIHLFLESIKDHSDPPPFPFTKLKLPLRVNAIPKLS